MNDSSPKSKAFLPVPVDPSFDLATLREFAVPQVIHPSKLDYADVSDIRALSGRWVERLVDLAYDPEVDHIAVTSKMSPVAIMCAAAAAFSLSETGKIKVAHFVYVRDKSEDGSSLSKWVSGDLELQEFYSDDDGAQV